MKRKLTTILTATFLFSLALALTGILSQRELTPAAQAKGSDRNSGRRCKLRNLEGTYGIFANGTVASAAQRGRPKINLNPERKRSTTEKGLIL